MLLQTAVGIALLTNVSIESSWPKLVDTAPTAAGLSPINSSLINYFSLYFPAVFTDQTTVVGVPPVACSGVGCSAYFFPGGYQSISQFPGSSVPPVGDATGYIVYGAPGYQTEFSPVLNNSIVANESDCRIYGSFNATVLTDMGVLLNICILPCGSYMLAGISEPLNRNTDENRDGVYER